MTKKKNTNILLRSPYKGKPVDSLAAKVMGVGNPNSALNLREKVKDVQKAIRKTDDEKIKKSLSTEREKLLRAVKQGPEPRTDSKAMERARRQLERAKWMSDNGYK